MSRDIAVLTPDTLALVRKVIEAHAAIGETLVPIQTLRTFAEQDALFAKGRTAPGEPCRHAGDNKARQPGMCPVHPLGLTVTAAIGGHSPHNWGCAADFWFMREGGLTSSVGPAVWQRMGEIGEAAGMKWGGRFPSRDLDHLELPGWKDVAASHDWKEIAATSAA
jgi:peptidoglycan L-alanyl-D-glutamate endopeptidase CwlK